MSTIHTTRHIEGHEFERMPRCFHCFPRNRGTSKQETDFIKFCKSFYPNLNDHNKSLIGKELDVVIPEMKLAIEYNGLYWHSTEYYKFKRGIQITKTNLCEELGYRLIYIWEDDWIDRNQETQNKLIEVFNSNEQIPTIDKYDRFWYSPLQFPNTNVNIIPPSMDERHIGGHTFHIENCGYFTIPPLHQTQNIV